MKWTIKPKIYGWYWWKQEKDIIPQMVYLTWEANMFKEGKIRLVFLFPMFTNEIKSVEELGGYYFGPIEEPNENTEYEE